MPPPAEFSDKPVSYRGLKNNESDRCVIKQNTKRGLNPRTAEVPVQHFAHVGVHKDKMWFEDEKSIDFHNHDEQYMVDGEEAEYNEKEEMDDDHQEEWAEPEAKYATAKSAPLQEEQVEDFYSAFQDLKENQYVLVFDGETYKNSDINNIKSVIENLVVNHNINISRIQLFKSIPIDFGIIVGD